MTSADGRARGDGRHEVVVVGGGYGGLRAVRELRREPVGITVIDRRSFHLFLPLVYQVATGVLAAGEIAQPLRAIFRRDRAVRVILGEVRGFDLARRRVRVERLANGEGPRETPYDSLIVAGGSEYSYFGHEEWRDIARDVRSLESALDVRRRILSAFEAAEVEEDPRGRAAWLTFVVVGAEPTGVELAGQLAIQLRHAQRRRAGHHRPRDQRQRAHTRAAGGDDPPPLSCPTTSPGLRDRVGRGRHAMSYEHEQFLTTVAQKARTSLAAAEVAARATLQTLAERLSAGQARKLAAQLPPEMAGWLRTNGRPEGFGAEEFVRRVAEREGTDVETATRHACAVFIALTRSVRPQEIADMTAELPKDFAPLLCGPDGQPDGFLPAAEFVRRVADRAGTDPDAARRAIDAVLETLGERLSGGEVDDLVRELPDEFADALQRGDALSNGAARRMSLDEFVRRIAEREGVTPDEAHAQARAVFATLREALPEREFDDVLAQLPRDYAALTARP